MEQNYLRKAKDIAITLLDIPVEIEDLGMVRHPIFSSSVVVFPDEEQRFGDLSDKATLKKAIQQRKELIEESDSLESLTYLITKPYRMQFLELIENTLPQSEFAVSLSRIWIDMENPNTCGVSLHTLIEWFKRADKSSLMDDEELEAFEALPDEFTVYRGMGDKSNEKGISYTLSLEKAQWFANRPPSERGYVLTGTAKKDDVLAFFTRRSEQEILIEPENVSDLHRME